MTSCAPSWFHDFFTIISLFQGSFGDAPMRNWGQWSKCSKSCGVGTQSRNRSLCTDLPPVYQQRNETEMRVCQAVRLCLGTKSIFTRRTIVIPRSLDWKRFIVATFFVSSSHQRHRCVQHQFDFSLGDVEIWAANPLAKWTALFQHYI